MIDIGLEMLGSQLSLNMSMDMCQNFLIHPRTKKIGWLLQSLHPTYHLRSGEEGYYCMMPTVKCFDGKFNLVPNYNPDRGPEMMYGSMGLVAFQNNSISMLFFTVTHNGNAAAYYWEKFCEASKDAFNNISINVLNGPNGELIHHWTDEESTLYANCNLKTGHSFFRLYTGVYS